MRDETSRVRAPVSAACADGDHDLLTLAAKAAGLDIDFGDRLVDGSNAVCYFNRGDGEFWNPLVDDGDVLRLAVKLRIKFFINEPCVYAGRVSDAGIVSVFEEFVDDPLAATRRAIVRAAAEIGRSMP
jgi:hypothetical protein